MEYFKQDQLSRVVLTITIMDSGYTDHNLWMVIEPKVLTQIYLQIMQKYIPQRLNLHVYCLSQALARYAAQVVLSYILYCKHWLSGELHKIR